MGATVLAEIPRPLFLAGQVLYFGIFALPIWLAGLVYFFTDAGKRYRLFGYLFVSVLVVLTVTGAKPYYSAPAYPLVFAAGGAWLGQGFEPRRGLRAAFTVVLVGSGVLLGSFTLPLLPLSTVDAALGSALGSIVRPTDLTHDMHDELVWAEQVEVLASVFNELTPAEQKTATIFTANYGQASALNFHGGAHGLPRATSGYMTHYLWGPDDSRTGPVVVVGGSAKMLAKICHAPEEVARIRHDVAMESDVPIHVCREHASLEAVWPKLKRYRHWRHE